MSYPEANTAIRDSVLQSPAEDAFDGLERALVSLTDATEVLTRRLDSAINRRPRTIEAKGIKEGPVEISGDSPLVDRLRAAAARVERLEYDMQGLLASLDL